MVWRRRNGGVSGRPPRCSLRGFLVVCSAGFLGAVPESEERFAPALLIVVQFTVGVEARQDLQTLVDDGVLPLGHRYGRDLVETDHEIGLRFGVSLAQLGDV